MRLNGHRVFREFFRFGIRERKTLTLSRRNSFGFNRFAGRCSRAENHFLGLGAEPATQHGGLTAIQTEFRDIKFVRIDGTLHHHLTQAIAGGDEYDLPESGLGVEREHDTSSAGIRAHHTLHARAQGDFGMCKALVDPVGDGAIIVERGEHFLRCFQDVIDAANVEERLLLSGEGRVWQVFGSG